MPRLLLLGVCLVLTISSAWAETPPETGPGAAIPAFDQAILGFREKCRCTAATFALMKDGKVVYERGYGWLDEAQTRNTLPTTPMRVASISKPITAAAIRKLIRDGKLTLDTKVFELLQLKPPAGATLDPRWQQITIGQLLKHDGGWDIKLLKFDPMFSAERVKKELRLEHPTRPVDIIDWMLGQPLSFDPGKRSAYSNFGYSLLGRVIEKVSGESYIEYLRQEIFKPAGIDPNEVWLAESDPAKRNPREPWYNEPNNVDVMDAHGGIVISAPVLCEYLNHYWINGDPRTSGDKREYTYTFFGSMPGTASISHQRLDGINFAAEFNGRHGDANQSQFTAELNKLISEWSR